MKGGGAASARKELCGIEVGCALGRSFRLADPSSRAAKQLRRSFRLPYPVFLDIVKLAREEKWYHDQITNVCGQPMPPLELMILGVRRGLQFQQYP